MDLGRGRRVRLVGRGEVTREAVFLPLGNIALRLEPEPLRIEIEALRLQVGLRGRAKAGEQVADRTTEVGDVEESGPPFAILVPHPKKPIPQWDQHFVQIDQSLP